MTRHDIYSINKQFYIYSINKENYIKIFIASHLYLFYQQRKLYQIFIASHLYLFHQQTILFITCNFIYNL